MIDKKLDMIIDILYKSKEADLYVRTYVNINISGSGVRFVSDIAFRKDDLAELKIILPIVPYPKITTLCRVVRSQESTVENSRRWDVAMEYSVISENDRDLLINYIFAKEREMLRLKKDLAG